MVEIRVTAGGRRRRAWAASASRGRKPMIESSRRRGHFDPRWHSNGSSRPATLMNAVQDSGTAIQRWESEGGSYSTKIEAPIPTGLDWYAFCNSYFPGRHRHDLEALKAYEAYRSAADSADLRFTKAFQAADVIRRQANPCGGRRAVLSI
jgi:hypothetical protein